MKQTDAQATESISLSWKLSGLALLCVALLTPLLLIGSQRGDLGTSAEASSVLKFAQVTVSEDGESALDDVAYDEAVDAEAELLTADSEDRNDAQPGALARLITEQGPAPEYVAEDVRRMVLDAVSIDLESSTSVGTVDHIRVPLTNCSQVTSDEYLLENAPEILSRIAVLKPHGPFDRVERIAGPPATVRALSFDGFRVEYCADGIRISHIELTPLEARPNALAVSDIYAQRNGGTEGVADAQSDGGLKIDSAAMDTRVKAASDVGLRAGREYGFYNSTPDTVVTADASIGRGAALIARLQSRPVAAPAQIEPPTELLALHGGAYLVSKDLQLHDTGLAQPYAKKPRIAANRLSGKLQAVAEISGSTVTLPFAAQAEEAESALRLTRRFKWEVQLRLTLIGHDPRGIDGIFGPGTRNAIARLQRDLKLPETGYLDDNTLRSLKRRSKSAFRKWRARRQKAREAKLVKKEPIVLPAQVSEVPSPRRATECARDQSGIIISNQSFDCDLSVLRESLSSLFGSNG